MEQRKYTFSKNERLCSKILIDDLFSKGDSFFKYPFKVIYKKVSPDEELIAKILISVPKRIFKRAVDRIKLKRLIREAYRKNKYILTDTSKTNPSVFIIGFVYTQKSILSYQEIERKIILILQSIKKQDEVSVG